MKLQWLKVFFSSWCPSLTSTVCGSDHTSLLQVWTFPQFQEAQIKTTRTKKLGTQVIKTEQHKKPIPRIDCFLYLGTLDSEKRQQTMKSTRIKKNHITGQCLCLFMSPWGHWRANSLCIVVRWNKKDVDMHILSSTVRREFGRVPWNQGPFVFYEKWLAIFSFAIRGLLGPNFSVFTDP